ncbi:MAG: helix-turn-helix transcriptional regulator [Bacteroidales bacterium]|nr:helix-turn-helix transcriptional regulator [Candidatus Colicola faecequi]
MEAHEKAAKQIGQNIREIRSAKHMHQCELAKMCNFEPSNLNRIEAGNTNPTLRSLVTIAEALGVTLSQLCKGL